MCFSYVKNSLGTFFAELAETRGRDKGRGEMLEE